MRRAFHRKRTPTLQDRPPRPISEAVTVADGKDIHESSRGACSPQGPNVLGVSNISQRRGGERPGDLRHHPVVAVGARAPAAGPASNRTQPRCQARRGAPPPRTSAGPRREKRDLIGRRRHLDDVGQLGHDPGAERIHGQIRELRCRDVPGLVVIPADLNEPKSLCDDRVRPGIHVAVRPAHDSVWGDERSEHRHHDHAVDHRGIHEVGVRDIRE